MRKIFTLFTALMVAYAANAGEYHITNASANAISDQVNSAEAGSIIYLADGNYTQSDQIKFKKNVTLMAEPGAHPVVFIHYYCTITNGADVTVNGIKFVGDNHIYHDKTKDAILYTADDDEVIAGTKAVGDVKVEAVYEDRAALDHCFRSHDASDGTEDLVLVNCEFKGFPDYIIYAQRGNRRMNSITINNCYFHDNVRSAVYVGYDSEASTNLACNAVTIENSTFANFTNVKEALISIKNAGTTASDIAVSVDHCTFYNFVKNTSGDYSFIDCRKLSNVAISNCIFAQPTAAMSKATYTYGGTITNCLDYNTNGYRTDGVTCTNNTTGNPLFLDVANGNYTLEEGSPALNYSIGGGATTNLGDSRWVPTTITPGYDKITYITPKDMDFSYANASGLHAYKAVSATSGGVVMQEVDTVPANTPLVLIGTHDETYTIAGAAYCSAPKVNLLKQGDGTTVFNGSTPDYLLYSDGKFYLIGSGTVATDKAYLHLDNAPSSAAGLRMIFDDNGATDINAIEADEEVVKFFENGRLLIKRDGVVYDALGRVMR